MMGIVRQALLGLHVFSGIIWVGGVLFIGWGVYPVVRKMPPTIQLQLFRSLMYWTHRPLTLAGSFVIVTGILLGTVVGPIRLWHDLFQTTYGHIWLTSLLTGLFSLGWGVFVGYPYAMNVFNDVSLCQQVEKGNKTALQKAIRKIIAIEAVEVAGFVALITLMMLWR